MEQPNNVLEKNIERDKEIPTMTARVCITGVLAMIVLFVLPVSDYVYAGDLDDGISKYTEESISGDDQALQTDTNINFIILEAISNEKKQQEKCKKNSNDGSCDNNENSVIIGAGAQGVGDITIIDLGGR